MLAEIGAHDVPQIVVYNKLDALQAQPRTLSDWIARDNGALVPRVFISATEGAGLDRLREWIARAAAGEPLSPSATPPNDAAPGRPSIAGQSDPSAQTTGIA